MARARSESPQTPAATAIAIADPLAILRTCLRRGKRRARATFNTSAAAGRAPPSRPPLSSREPGPPSRAAATPDRPSPALAYADTLTELREIWQAAHHTATTTLVSGLTAARAIHAPGRAVRASSSAESGDRPRPRSRRRRWPDRLWESRPRRRRGGARRAARRRRASEQQGCGLSRPCPCVFRSTFPGEKA